MPLQPENNKNYWPLLLTDELYLLPADLAQQRQEQTDVQAPALQERHAAAGPQSQAAAEVPAPRQETQANPVAPQPDLIWGSLRRGVLILVDYPAHPLMDRPDGLFLVEVLKAVGFDFKEVATLNVSRCKTSADWEYVRQLSWQHALIFGVDHPELTFTQQNGLYELRNWENRLLIQADKLSDIRNDTGSKKKLWNLLKQVFV
ncbi:hypothetical protein [Cesiribacter sp. SM1]|uniref:hypothetical protein n=1 Tax=Cesiribacter sp. SM1 TaxID=2861196 RepID=UPI001CD7DDE2|nr:hypothetical protein [Cesiribacter sp. SM1]